MKMPLGNDQATIYQRPVELLQNLIRFNTSNPPGNEGECVAYIDHLLSSAGFDTTILAKDSDRPNLIARLAGRGDAPPLLLQGHVDVVPTDADKWEHPPFEGKIAKGFVWGRGALDMKSGVAMMVSAFLRAKTEGLMPSGDVILAILSDEETGSEFGAKFLVENHPEYFRGVKYAIGEFGGFPLYFGKKKIYHIQVTEKQRSRIRAVISGPDAYGSILPPKNNATGKLARMISYLDKQNLPAHVTMVPRMMIEKMSPSLPFPNNFIMRQLMNPKYTNLILKTLGKRGTTLYPIFHNVINTLMIKGGQTENIMLPKEYKVMLSGYLLPGFTPDDAISELPKKISEGIEFETLLYEPVPTEPDMGLYNLLSDILQEADPACTIVPLMLPAATDGRYFSKLGIQTYGFLPMILPSNFDFAEHTHADNERIPLESMPFGTEAIYSLLQRFGKD